MADGKNDGPPSPSLILRILGGGYLLYLSWDLCWAVDVLFQVAGIVFATVGIILLGTSISALIHSDYFYDSAKKPEDTPEEKK